MFAIFAAAVGIMIVAGMVGVLWIDAARPLWVDLTPDTLFVALETSGRPMQALYRLEAWAARDGWTGDRLRLAGDLRRQAGDPHTAAIYWERARRLLPDDVPLLRDLAETYLELDEWTRAADVLTTLVDNSPNAAERQWAAFHLGIIRAAVAPAAAADDLRIALLDPAYRPVASALISVLTRPDDPLRTVRAGAALADAALWNYAELIFSYGFENPETAALALAYGAFTRDQQGKDGGDWIERAVALAPDDARVRYLEGLHYRAIRDYEASLDALAAAAALDPTRPEVYAELGTAYWLSGDRLTGDYWIRRAIELTGDDPVARQAYQTLLESMVTEERSLLESLGIDLDTPPGTAEATDAEATAEPTAESISP